MPNQDRLDIAEIIDFARYPIREPSLFSGGVVERCRAELTEDGACQLDGFMRPAATQAVLAEAEMLSGKAFRTDATHNAYFTEVPAGLTDEDPRAVSVHSSKRALGEPQTEQAAGHPALPGHDGPAQVITPAAASAARLPG